ncbi:MAG TPA: C4-dicarboxylate transporter DcuC [Negativicutes bacterium]|nr:C4-dicarboxylate transporter DcuC [Negativicutes bacterium]
MVWVGAIIVLLTFAAIIKKFETRLVLFLSGVVMAALSGKPTEAITAFSAAMVNSGLVPVICTVMGFAFVMKLTKCDAHLVHLLAGVLGRFRIVLIPGTVIVTFLINIALPSAAGCGAAVGAIMIPTLIGSGINPIMAACAVLAGTWGSVFNPGSAHVPFIAKLGNTDVMTVIAGHTIPSVIGIGVVAVLLTIIARVLKEDGSGEASTATATKINSDFKVQWYKAVVPIIPLLLLVLGSKQVNLLPGPEISVPAAMLIGTALGFAVTLTKVDEVSKQFFDGMGSAYGNVIGIIIAAAVFTKGMELIGLTGALITAMKSSESIARLAATFGPFIIAVLGGSGDAATLAFNGAITPHAAQFGFGILPMGSQAFIAGALGRSMSPVAGVAIVCAGLAQVNPIDMAKRNAIPMIVTAIISMFILL